MDYGRTLHEYQELILAREVVKDIFSNCKIHEWSSNKCHFDVNEHLIEALFPEDYKEAVKTAQEDYRLRKAVEKNV
jgi:hypothetical protein